MLSMEQKIEWYVVYTRPRWEKKVAASLQLKGIEHYCPLNKVQKQWSDRKKVVFEPLFKGYVFVRISETLKWNIKQVDGILNYVHWLGKPAKIKNEDIDTIRKFLNEFNEVNVLDRKLELESKIIVKQGVLMNYRGIIMEVSGNMAKVKIDSMGMDLIAFFDKNNLEVLQYNLTGTL